MRAATLIVSGRFTSGAEELSSVELDVLSVEELLSEELSVVEEVEELEELLAELPEQALNVSAHIAAIKAALNLFLIFIEYLLSLWVLARFFL